MMLTGDEQHEFRVALSRFAQARLSEAENHRQTDCLFTLKVIPSFSNVRLWTVVGGTELRADCLTWRQHEDWKREASVKQLIQLRRGLPAGLEPTMETHSQTLPPAPAQELRQTLSSLRLPVLVIQPSLIGIDGTIYRIKFSSGIQLSWWENTPPEWDELENFVRSFLNQVGDSYDE